jgi:hypothetical protein
MSFAIVSDFAGHSITLETSRIVTVEDLYKAIEDATGMKNFKIIVDADFLPRSSEIMERYWYSKLIRVNAFLPKKPAIPYEEQYVKYVLRYEGNIKIPPAETPIRQSDLLAIIESNIRASLLDSSISSANISGTSISPVRDDVILPRISGHRPIEVTFSPIAAAASYGGRKKGKSKSKSKSSGRKKPRRRTHSRSQRK